MHYNTLRGFGSADFFTNYSLLINQPPLLRVLKIIPAIFLAFVCAVGALTTDRLPRLVTKPRNELC